MYVHIAAQSLMNGFVPPAVPIVRKFASMTERTSGVREDMESFDGEGLEEGEKKAVVSGSILSVVKVR